MEATSRLPERPVFPGHIPHSEPPQTITPLIPVYIECERFAKAGAVRTSLPEKG